MKLSPPVEQYLTGDKPTHSSFTKLEKYVNGVSQDEIERLLSKGGYLSKDSKPTKNAAKTGIIDLCDGKILWNLLETKRAVVLQMKIEERERVSEEERRLERTSMMEPKWVDLGTIGTWFDASNIKVGRWLDELGLRSMPEKQKNESGDYDMLDVAREAQQKQIAGFIGKEPTKKAYDMGLAQKITVMNRKRKEINIVQWNLELCKAVFVKVGHKLDHERKSLLRGKGKNGDVTITTVDDRARDIYEKWSELQSEGRASEAHKLISKQSFFVLEKMDVHMNRPGFFTEV